EVSALRLHAARKVIAKKYRPYYVNAPVIMLSMVETAGVGEYGRITVMGHVSRPGSVPLAGARGMKLSAAIQGAGGFSKSAKKSDVRVTRTDNYGRKVQTSVDFDAIGRGGSASADIQLFNGDVVYVPERVF
ncbi:MAG TPA: SLBB domain-containing protein, partial [Pontiella sp.]